MKKYIWIIYREIFEKEGYFINKNYEVETYGTEKTYEDALKIGKEFLNKFCDEKLDLDIQII